MKAIFGGTVKKPLMTKVSMRHLNEVVRERNQYNRDAVEAWQDFINLKGRMDTEISKVSKRNNFLVEELESWKQQVASTFSISQSTLTFLICSFSSFRPLPNNSPRKHKISRSKLSLTSAKIAALLPSLTSKKTMLLALPFVYQEPRNSVMMHWRL